MYGGRVYPMPGESTVYRAGTFVLVPAPGFRTPEPRHLVDEPPAEWLPAHSPRPNGRTPDGLAPNGLAPNGLAPNGLAPNGRPDRRPDPVSNGPTGRRADPDDATLADALTRAKAGDEAGFVTLYRAMAPRLHRYATALVGCDADDATAEAWLQIARDVRRFSGDVDGFRGWAARITRNRALDMLRDRGHSPATDGVEVLARMAGPNDTSSAALDAISTADAIALIATLPTDQAEAVLLRAVVGLDSNAAGEVLGKRAGAVRVAAHRGLRQLARRLGERTPEGEVASASGRSLGAHP